MASLRPKHRVLLSIHSSKLLEPSIGSEESYSLFYTSCPINLKKKLRRLWLINRKLLSVLIHYGIIELPLFCIEAPWRRSRIHNLVNRVFSSDLIQDTGRVCNPPNSDPELRPKSLTQKSDPKIQTPNRTTTPTGPRTDRTIPYESPWPIGTLSASSIATTTRAVDRAGQLGGMTEQGVTEDVPKLCTEA